MKTVFCIALVIFIGLSAGVTNAQDPDPMPPNPLIEPKVLDIGQKAQETLKVKLEHRIDEMQAVCDLSDVQVKKLKLASKGAVIEAISTMEKKVKQLMKGEMLNGPPRIAPENAQENEIDQAGQIPKAGGEQKRVFLLPIEPEFGFPTSLVAPIKAEDTKTWKLAVKKTLTDEQHKKYEAVVAERLKFQRTAAAQSFVAKVDIDLLLSAGQREQLTEFIDKEYGEELTVLNAEKDRQFILDGAPSGEKPLGKNSPLRKILSENQQTLWERIVTPKLERIRLEAAMVKKMFNLRKLND